MTLAELARTAFWALAANKLRSALTILGIVIGVSAVIALLAVGQGAQNAVTGRIRALGTDLLFVTPGSSSSSGVQGGLGSAVTLTLEDAAALVDAPAVRAVAPELTAQSQVIAGSTNTFTRVVGVTPAYADVRNYAVADGRFISDEDVSTNATVIVLGSNVAATLFGDVQPVGQTVRVGNMTAEVVGVLASKGGTALGFQDNQVLVPITTVMARLSRSRTAAGATNVSQINVQAMNDRSVDAAKAQISQVLRARHEVVDDDFVVTSQQDTIQTLAETTNVFVVFLGAIAGISLLVGGIGIMNIMLVSVTERTREIGIRKALGATRRDLALQFLVEAVILSAVGGVLGILGGLAGAHFVSGLRLNGQVLTAAVTPNVVALSVVVAVTVGLFFGIYPAVRASSLHPIEALRHE